MTKGTLIIGYGTRTGNLTDILETQAARLRARGRENVHVAYFRVSSPTIQEAVSQMAADGVDEILAVPYYIAEGALTNKLIPEKLGISGKSGVADIDGKKVSISLAPAFGRSRILTNIVLDRIAGAGGSMDDGILVLGHGTRDPTTENSKVVAMNADRLRAIGYKHVAHSFNEFNEPTIKDMLEKLVGEGVRRIVVVPLFVANGVHLGEEIPEQLGIPSYSNGGTTEISGKTVEIVYTRPMEDDPRLLDFIDREVSEFCGE